MYQSTNTTKPNTKRRRPVSLRAAWSAAIVAALLLQTLLPATAFADGDYGWAVPLGSGAETVGYAIAVDSAGNVLTTGSFFGGGDFSPNASTPIVNTTGDEDVYISRLNTDGQFDGNAKEWKVGGTVKDIGRAIAVDSADNIIVAGQFRGTADFDPGAPSQSLTTVAGDDIFLLKLANDGTFQWVKGYGSAGEDIGYGTAVDGADSVYLVGHFSNSVEFDPANAGGSGLLTSGGSTDGFLLKLDSTGAFQWVKSVTSPSPNRTIAVTTDSGFVYSGGYFQGTANFGGTTIPTNGGRDAFVTKHALDGTFQWAKRMGGSESDVTYALDVDGSGNIYLTGVFSGTANFDTSGIGTFNLTTTGGRDAFVAKLDGNGNLLWAKNMGGVDNDEGFGIKVGNDGRIYVTGYFNGAATFPAGGATTLTAAGGNNAFLAVFDDAGNLQIARQLGSGANAIARAIALDGANNAAMTGDFIGTGDFDPDPVGSANLTSVSSTDAFVVELTSNTGPVNTAPVAADDAYAFNQGATNEALDVLANDSDTEDGKPTLQSIDDSSLSGTAVISGSVISYSTPNPDFTGTDIFNYTVQDTEGLTATATVTVTINPTGTGNTPPVANTQTVGMVKNDSKTITLTGSDTDGDPLTFSIVAGPSNGTLGAVTPTGDTSATVQYTPNVDYTGGDSFTFQVDDGNLGTATATVNINVAEEPGTAPVANDVTASGDEDSTFTVTFSATDADAGDSLSYSIVSTPTNGTLGSVTGDTVEYTPAADFNGADSFTYMVMDSAGLTDTATANITVNAVNDAPTAPSQPIEVGVGEDTTQTIELTGGDLDGDDLTFSIVTQPGNGTLGAITKTGISTATVEYTPNAEFVGTDSFTYEVSDGTATAQATVNITVNAMNDAPVANDATATATVGDEVTTATVTLSATDADGDELTFSIISLPTSGTLGTITVIDDTSASIVYTPQTAGEFTFEFEVDDGNGGTDTGTVTVTVTEVTGGGGGDDEGVDVFLPITPRAD